MTRRLPLLAGAALAAASLLVPASAAHADEHEVPDWPQPGQARQLCAQPWVGEALGYNVIFGTGVIMGTDDPDLIIASNQPDQVYALKGDDIVCLFAGDDYAEGNQDDDIVFGMDGDDDEYGNAGQDALFGDN